MDILDRTPAFDAFKELVVATFGMPLPDDPLDGGEHEVASSLF